MSSGEDSETAAPRADLADAAAWCALGAAVLIASLAMDRLEDQDVTPITAPGLLPGLLGIALLLLGGLLAWRSLGRGIAGRGVPPARPRGSLRRVAMVIGLCVAFDTVLVGHGLPFWAAAAMFVTVAILALQHAGRVAAGQSLTLGAVLMAALTGLGAGAAITLVFQTLFLVRLP